MNHNEYANNLTNEDFTDAGEYIIQIQSTYPRNVQAVDYFRKNLKELNETQGSKYGFEVFESTIEADSEGVIGFMFKTDGFVAPILDWVFGQGGKIGQSTVSMGVLK